MQMSNNINQDSVKAMSKNLQEWVVDVEHHAMFSGQSFHDSLCDIQEGSASPLTEAQCAIVMEAMDSYWD